MDLEEAIQLRKSPLNLLIGQVIERLRLEKRIEEADLAEALGVALSYLRVIELGTRALPVYSALGLADLGIDFTQACVLISVIQFLDQRDPNEQAYDSRKIVERIVRLKPRAPSLRPILDWVEEACLDAEKPEKGLRETYKDQSVIDRAIKTLRMDAPRIKQDSDAAASSYQQSQEALSPFFADAVSSLVNRLSAFVPFTDANRIALWEKSNSERMKGVLAYVEDAQDLIDSAEDFGWSFLLNEHKPTVMIYVPSATQRIVQLERDLREKLRKKIVKRQRAADILENVRIKLIPKKLEPACDRALWMNLDQSPVADLSERRNARRFSTAWLYLVRPDAVNVPVEPNVVGLLAMTHDKADLASVYSAAMERSHIQLWRNIFDAAAK